MLPLKLVADSLCSPASYITDSPLGNSSFAFPLPRTLAFWKAPGGEGSVKSVFEDNECVVVVASETDA